MELTGLGKVKDARTVVLKSTGANRYQVTTLRYSVASYVGYLRGQDARIKHVAEALKEPLS